jgi:hypothetical protein
MVAGGFVWKFDTLGTGGEGDNRDGAKVAKEDAKELIEYDRLTLGFVLQLERVAGCGRFGQVVAGFGTTSNIQVNARHERILRITARVDWPWRSLRNTPGFRGCGVGFFLDF